MNWPWQRSIQARVVLILGGLLSLVLLFINLEMGRVLSQAQREEGANHLQIQALLAAHSLEDPLSGYRRELEDHEQEHHQERNSRTTRLPDWSASFAQESGAQVLIVDRRGQVLAGDSRSSLTFEELQAAEHGRPWQRFTPETIYATAPVNQRQRLLGVVRLAIPGAAAEARSRSLILSLATASLLALGLALLAAVWLSRRLVAPLRQLEVSALRAAQGQWDEPLEVSGHDELASLSRAFATMLSQLRAVLERQRRFVSSASHELRTPLTRIKLRSEALASGGLQDPQVAEKFATELDGEVDGLIRLSNSLLDLARLEEGADSGVTSDTAAVVQAALDSAGVLARHKGVHLRCQLPESLPPLRLAPLSLRSLLENLLDNAVKYTPAGGEVGLLAERTEQGVRLQVHDTGVGIESQHLPRLFDRFYRVDSARGKGGAGLGLALVKAAAESAGGSVQVASVAGQGSRFTVDLPGC